MSLNLKPISWEPTGRKSEVLDELNQPTGKLCWTGAIGEQQIQDDQGAWYPYLWDAQTYELRYAHDDIRCEFASGEQIIKKAGQKICKSLKFFVERETSPGVWKTQPHGVPTRQIRHDKKFIKGAGLIDSEGTAVGWLTFPDAQYDLNIGIQAGRSKRAMMGFRFRAPINARIRFKIVKDGIEPRADGYQLIETTNGKPEPNTETRTVGVRFKQYNVKWTWEEAEYHSVVVEDSINYPGEKKGVITVGPFDVIANEWLEILPLTWGLTEPSDDCYEYNRTTYNDQTGYGKLICGTYGGYGRAEEPGHTWTNVTAIGTAENGCYIKIHDCTKSNTPKVDMYAVDARNVTAWGAAYRPYTHTTRHPAKVDWDNICDASPDISPEIKTLIQARFDDDHVSGDDIGIVFLKDSVGNNVGYYRSEESGTGAQLYIVYTAAGVDVSAATDSLILTEYSAAVNAEISFTAGIDALVLTENAADVNLDVSVSAGVDALVITEYSATVNAGVSFTADINALVLTEYNPSIGLGINVSAGIDALVLTEYSATVNAEISFTAGVDDLILTEYSASVNDEISFTSGVDNLILTEYLANVNAEVDFTADVDNLILTEYNAAVIAGMEFTAGVDNLILAEYAAVVDVGVVAYNRRGSGNFGFSFRDGWR